MKSTTLSAGGRKQVATRRRHRAPERLLIVDASLTPKTVVRLRERGRDAISVKELGWRTYLDPDLLHEVFGRFPQAVLVTGDDKMPEEHPLVIEREAATIATIEPWDRRPRQPLTLPPGLSSEEAWKREVVQRWAHAMATQQYRSVRRYSRDRGAKWTPTIRNPQGRLFTLPGEQATG